MEYQKKPVIRNGSFRDMRLTVGQLAELFEVSQTTLYQFEKEGLIKGLPTRVGKMEKKVYGWNDVLTLTTRLASRVVKPKDLKVKLFNNIKGGVGKSTIVSQVAMRASSLGIKTLLIDLDPQAQASMVLGFGSDDELPTFGDIIDGSISVTNAIQEITPLLHAIPSNLNLSTLEMDLFTMPKREEKIVRIVEQIRGDWDLILIDTNPAPSLLNINAYLAADEICVVAQTDFLSVNGLKKLFNILKDLEDNYNIEPAVRIIPNLFDMRDGIAQESLGALRKFYGGMLTNTVVRKNTDIREAQKLAQAIWQYDKRSTGAEDISSLTRELILEDHISASITPGANHPQGYLPSAHSPSTGEVNV